jgi:hypothetical protein
VFVSGGQGGKGHMYLRAPDWVVLCVPVHAINLLTFETKKAHPQTHQNKNVGSL